MNTKILIATHGIFADGIYESLKIIAGEKNNVERLNAYVDKNIDYSKLIKDIVSNHNYKESNLLVITDLFGGSVNNEFLKYIMQYPFYLVSGLNLGMLLEFVLSTKELNNETIKEIIDRSKNNIVLCNDILHSEDSSDSDF